KFFEWAAESVLRRARTPQRLLLGVVVGGGLLSALFVNDTVCLVVTPVLLAALGPLRRRPTPYLLGLAMGANVGSVLSITGNPQNMLVGIWSGASFGGFLVRMLPVGVGGLAITYGCLRWSYRDELREPFREGLETGPLARLRLEPRHATERGHGGALQPRVQRARGHAVAQRHSQPPPHGSRVAPRRQELHVRRQPAPHRLDGEPDRGGKGRDTWRAD